MITKLTDVQSELHKLRTQSHVRGEKTGFKCLDEIWSVKKGYPLFIAGEPHSGKTEFWFEICLYLSKSKGWKHLILSPESGTPEEIYASLCHKYHRKNYRQYFKEGRKYDEYQTEAEVASSEMFVSEHFYVLDPDSDEVQSIINGDLEMNKFYELVDEIEMLEGFNFDTVTIDPWNELKPDNSLNLQRDELLASYLNTVRRKSKKHHRIDCLINHVTDSPVMYHEEEDDRGNKVRIGYHLPATPKQWAGGQTWHRKGFQMLLIYRPYPWMSSPIVKGAQPSGVLENETWVMVQKARPKGTATYKGQVSLFFDVAKNSYYEMATPQRKITSESGRITENHRLYMGEGYEHREPLKEESEHDLPIGDDPVF